MQAAGAACSLPGGEKTVPADDAKDTAVRSVF